MSSSKWNAVAAAITLLLATPISSHMMMSTPQPYGKSSLDNSPLVAAGTNFPCKQRSGAYLDEGARAKNKMAVGAPQTLSFVGSATHGGGSCQLSLTTDKEPTKTSKWAVILSIEGGCPGGANGGTPATFQYKIPEAVAPGDYTLAWTWFNKIGNREMYMNCAPITVTGGSNKRTLNDTGYEVSIDAVLGKRDNTLPAMFVANVANGCTTEDSQDLAFPDPGEVVQKSSSGSTLAPPKGTCPKEPKVNLGASAPSSPSTNSSAPASSNSTVAAPGGISVTPVTATILASPSASVAAPSASPASPSAAASPVSPSAPSSPPISGTNSTSPAGSASSGVPLTGTGQSCSGTSMLCSADGTQFGICNNGQAIMQPVAAGTKCTNGQIGFAKRSAKFSKAKKVGGWC